MRVIPVIDVLCGQVVRGVAGRRSEYRPIVSQIAADSCPATVARAIVERFGFDTAYVADLDAIAGRAPNVAAWKEIQQARLALWLDAGITTARSCLALHKLLTSESIRANIIIALESLQDDLDGEDWIDARARSQAFTFSLDLKAGVPIHNIAKWRNHSPIEIAKSAHAHGFSDIIVLDLADVGTDGGTRTLSLCKQMIAELHPVNVIAGGGVRNITDLKALADAGCSAALVASALHDGRLTRSDLNQQTTDH
jgi:phosphoribosylformimino-5-aminoimidazole carboxamide ribotide isomerase